MAILLAAAWLALPAVQYVGTFQRTQVQTGERAELPPMALWDLTPFYLALLVGTILLVALRAMKRGRQEASVESR